MGNNLKKLRKSRGWTHQEAADAMGISRSQIIKLERSERKLTEQYIMAAARAFGVDEAAVFTEEASVPVIGKVGGTAKDADPAAVERRAAMEVAIRAKRLLEARLKDPDSVRYRTVLAREGVVCGTFNAKNGFGGYADEEPFLGLGYPETAVYLAGDPGFRRGWDANCLSAEGFIRID